MIERLPGNVAGPIAAEHAGQPLKYLYFWGQDGHTYGSAKRNLMAHKAWLVGDDEAAAKILAAGHPGDARKTAMEPLTVDWEAHRFNIVVRGKVARFGQQAGLKEFLLGTGNRVPSRSARRVGSTCWASR